MSGIELIYEHGVTLVGGGPVTGQLLSRCRTYAPTLIAADGGADQASALGQAPNLIVGDMDSLVNHQTWRDSGIQIYEFVEQETIDFEKCLYATKAPFYLGCGFLGGRLDHELAAISALLRFADKRVILLGDELCFLCPPELRIDLPPGTRFSLVPLRKVTGDQSVGLEWSIRDLTLEPGGRIGTSNRTTGPVHISFDRQGALVILPLECLDAVLAAFDALG